MKPCFVLAVFCAAGLPLVDLHSCPQPQKQQAKTGQHPIEGTWTQIYYESDGQLFSTVANERLLSMPPPLGRTSWKYVPYIWKISKDLMDEG